MSILSSANAANWRLWGHSNQFRNVGWLTGHLSMNDKGEMVLAQTNTAGSHLPVGVVREYAQQENKNPLPLRFSSENINFNPDVARGIKNGSSLVVTLTGRICGGKDSQIQECLALFEPRVINFPSVLSMPADARFRIKVPKQNDNGLRLINDVPGAANPNANRILLTGVVRESFQGKKTTPDGVMPIHVLTLQQSANPEDRILIRVLGDYAKALKSRVTPGMIIAVEGEYRVTNMAKDGEPPIHVPYIRTTADRVLLATGTEGRPDEEILPEWILELRASTQESPRRRPNHHATADATTTPPPTSPTADLSWLSESA